MARRFIQAITCDSDCAFSKGHADLQLKSVHEGNKVFYIAPEQDRWMCNSAWCFNAAMAFDVVRSIAPMVAAVASELFRCSLNAPQYGRSFQRGFDLGFNRRTIRLVFSPSAFDEDECTSLQPRFRSLQLFESAKHVYCTRYDTSSASRVQLVKARARKLISADDLAVRISTA